MDFNNETTIATPSFELVKILIMEKQENVSLALALYEKNKALDLETDHELAWVISRNKVFFLSIEAWLKDSLGEEKLSEFWKGLDNKSGDVQLRLFREMCGFLYDNGLTKINLRKSRRGPPIAEKENEDDGF